MILENYLSNRIRWSLWSRKELFVLVET